MLGLLFALSLIVVDGDTVKLDGQRLRIANIDAPETNRQRAGCNYEVELGLKSSTALSKLLAAGEPKIQWLGKQDKYQRPLVLITVNGKDVGQSLIEMNLAQPWVGRKANWCR